MPIRTACNCKTTQMEDNEAGWLNQAQPGHIQIIKDEFFGLFLVHFWSTRVEVKLEPINTNVK